jgi:hypothetical protein
MNTFQVILTITCFLIIGWIGFYIAMYFAQIILKRKFTIRTVFNNFGQKMWMTAGLGIIFSSLYLFIVFFGAQIDPQKKLALFFKAYENPIHYIYLGLLIFACLTLTTYIARVIIIFLYNTRKK